MEDLAKSSLPVIKVIGVGGGGCNAVDRMIENEVTDVEFIALNTDSQVLFYSQADMKIELGRKATAGLGAGMRPEVGRQAAEEALDELEDAIRGADMVFITAGEGGGTGTGAAPVVAEVAKKVGALTIGVVTHPFRFEGKRRMDYAVEGTEKLREVCDAVIIVKNQNLLKLEEGRLTAAEAFLAADRVLVNGVRGISDLVTKPGIVNTDFADVRTVLADAGTALMGIGVAKGEDRAIKATQAALESPLIDMSIQGATGVLVNISGAVSQMGITEQEDAIGVIAELAHPDANIIYGLSNDENLGDEMRVTIVATGFDAEQERFDAAANNATATTNDPNSTLFNETSGSTTNTGLFGDSPAPAPAAEPISYRDEAPRYRDEAPRYREERREDSYSRRGDDGGMYAPKRRNIDIPWG
ncbi:MAG: cell division protein FtsZ [Corynebacterium sp.]|nr:cell division protein FtsZ [Corynebacterium sp.]